MACRLLTPPQQTPRPQRGWGHSGQRRKGRGEGQGRLQRRTAGEAGSCQEAATRRGCRRAGAHPGLPRWSPSRTRCQTTQLHCCALWRHRCGAPFPSIGAFKCKIHAWFHGAKKWCKQIDAFKYLVSWFKQLHKYALSTVAHKIRICAIKMKYIIIKIKCVLSMVAHIWLSLFRMAPLSIFIVPTLAIIHSTQAPTASHHWEVATTCIV